MEGRCTDPERVPEMKVLTPQGCEVRWNMLWIRYSSESLAKLSDTLGTIKLIRSFCSRITKPTDLTDSSPVDFLAMMNLPSGGCWLLPSCSSRVGAII